jgi:2-polyprenyl-3-methyl-5-hydroxy-6-metoxy-1,4-benzoquinol methylase
MPYDACVLCGAAHPRLDCRISLRGKLDADVTRCPACGLLFVNPIPGPQEIASLYDAGYWDPDPPGRGVLEAYRRYPRHYRFGAAYGRWLSRLAPSGTMLEIGCGLPFFLKGVADNCAWEVEGVDGAHGIAEFARQKLGLKVREAAFAAGLFPAGSFDLVRAKDVIEHVPEPMPFLAATVEALKPSGRLELWLPNGPLDLAEARRVHRRGGRAVMGAGHVLFISPRVLRKMLRQAGLGVEAHTVSGFRYALKAMGMLRGRGPARVSGMAGDGSPYQAVSLSAWRQPPPERGLKGSRLYAAYRWWRSHHPALPAWFPLGFRQRVVARKAASR